MAALIFLALVCSQLQSQQSDPKPPQVGGADIVTLTRKPTSSGKKLEFLSVVLFPGRGMNVFQITANIPCKGTVPLLRSPSIAEAAGQLNGTGADEFGNLNHSFGGAFLIPFLQSHWRRAFAGRQDRQCNLAGSYHPFANGFFGQVRSPRPDQSVEG